MLKTEIHIIDSKGKHHHIPINTCCNDCKRKFTANESKYTAGISAKFVYYKKDSPPICKACLDRRYGLAKFRNSKASEIKSKNKF